MHKSFGKQLAEERKKQGLEVVEFAKMCGTSESNITLIENGKLSPDKKILPKIADALHFKLLVVLNWYLEGVNEV